MHIDDALRYVEELLAQQDKRLLNDVQRAVFRGSWLGKSYKEIRRDCPGCGLPYLMKDVGPGLWNLLSEVVGEEVTKKNLRGPIERSRHQLAIVGGTDNKPPTQVGRLPDPQLPAAPIEFQGLPWFGADTDGDRHFRPTVITRQDWDSAPDVSQFYGRDRDLERLRQWLTIEGCRLVTIHGIGGIGKTHFSVKLAQQVREDFDCVVWRSLNRWQALSRPPQLDELLTDLIGFLSNQQQTGNDLTQLMFYLSHHSCLIVLDGFEAVLQSGVHDGSYQPGYESYGELLRRLGETAHQSRVVLTSREKPREIAHLEGDTLPVRSHPLEGMGELAGQHIFSAKGVFSGSEPNWNTLIRRYTGNPLALNVVATRISAVFGGNVNNFLEQLEQNTLVFGEIWDVLGHQFNRLSELEKTILQCLAAHSEPAEVPEMLQSLSESISRMQLQEGLQSLLRRSLIELEASHYSLHPLMLEYLAALKHSQN